MKVGKMKLKVYKTLVAVLAFILAGTQYVFAVSYVGVPSGLIYQAYVEYKDSDTVTITPGYGEIVGNYWEITTPKDHDMTSLATGEDFHYIYIDHSDSNYPDPNIIDSTTEPSWSDGKLGWYNGDDRCIGVVWSPSGSATVLDFVSNSSQKYIVNDTTGYGIKHILDNGNPNGDWQTVECTAYTPVNTISIFINAGGKDAGSEVIAQVRAYECILSRIYASGYARAATQGWIDIERGSSRDLMWYGQDNDDNQFDIFIQGYQIER